MDSARQDDIGICQVEKKKEGVGEKDNKRNGFSEEERKRNMSTREDKEEIRETHTSKRNELPMQSERGTCQIEVFAWECEAGGRAAHKPIDKRCKRHFSNHT